MSLKSFINESSTYNIIKIWSAQLKFMDLPFITFVMWIFVCFQLVKTVMFLYMAVAALAHILKASVTLHTSLFTYKHNAEYLS